MNVKTKIAALLAASAMLSVPAAALAGGPNYAPEKPHPPHPTKPTPGPKASMAEKVAAYGARCQGQSKKHIPGQKGTPFSQCVTAMAKAANGVQAKVACKEFPKKKHVKGEKGTPFSQCVAKANEVRKEAKAS
ncbi:MAG: hypothetical protein JST08_18885 [Actinobacteria bacterium]|nr:hypothetical protein [Actinomycetota bacterium]